MKRKNKERQAISGWRAQKTGIANTSDKEKLHLAKQKLTYDYHRIKWHENRFLKLDEEWDNIFNLLQVKPITLFYEDLVENKTRTVKDLVQSIINEYIARYLAIPEPGLIKLADEQTEMFLEYFQKDKLKNNAT